MSRRFRNATDVVHWIKRNAIDSKDPEFEAKWWCCYRSTQQLIDDTTKHIAQYLMDGVGPTTIESVEDFINDWYEGGDDSEGVLRIDDEIEADLRNFFLSGR